MHTRPVIIICALAFALVLAGCATPTGRDTARRLFPDFAALTPQADLPNPLVMLDGRPVESARQWNRERRPELKALFEHYMYGMIPPKPSAMAMKVEGVYPDFLGGSATLKVVTLKAGPEPTAPRIDLMLVVPNARSAAAPIFLAMDFCGNQALTADTRVPLAHSWMANGVKGCTNNAATEASRGFQSADWPLAEIIRRGYGVAAFYSGDVDSDRAEVSSGVYAWLADGDPAKNPAADRGTIAAWAWGFHRCVDYLVTDKDVDAHRIAALGHSRNGKTALLAAAFDERIAMAFPHQAGCGGSAPSRVSNEDANRTANSHETVKAINTHFAHWFNGIFKQFNDAPERLPFDQNCLVALCAPRPVLLSAAQGDQWANPAGQFEVAKAADPVYRLLGVKGLGVRDLPPQRQLVGDRLGYYLREGNHSMNARDWSVFMDFADAQWKHGTK